MHCGKQPLFRITPLNRYYFTTKMKIKEGRQIGHLPLSITTEVCLFVASFLPMLYINIPLCVFVYTQSGRKEPHSSKQPRHGTAGVEPKLPQGVLVCVCARGRECVRVCIVCQSI